MRVGVIGAGSFGITLSLLLAENAEVVLYSRSKERNDRINTTHQSHGIDLPENIFATNIIEEVCENKLLFPVVPSSSFRAMIRSFREALSPSHILIHATKGLDVAGIKDDQLMDAYFHRKEVHTMSEIIRKESDVKRVGALAGPNLAKEILDGQPAAAVIASEFDEVIQLGTKALSSRKFFTFSAHDLKGTEIAGAYKNIIALGTGMLTGMGLGKNMQAILINRGLQEMVRFGVGMGTTKNPFFGTAGVGDLVATATSENSRNFTFGKRLASGEAMEDIYKTTDEIVEGVRTLKIIRQLARNEKISLPITEMIYKVVFDQLDPDTAIRFLMSYSRAEDVDFI